MKGRSSFLGIAQSHHFYSECFICSYVKLYLFESIDIACIARQLQALHVSKRHGAGCKCADTKVVRVVIPAAR